MTSATYPFHPGDIVDDLVFEYLQPVTLTVALCHPFPLDHVRRDDILTPALDLIATDQTGFVITVLANRLASLYTFARPTTLEQLRYNHRVASDYYPVRQRAADEARAAYDEVQVRFDETLYMTDRLLRRPGQITVDVNDAEYRAAARLNQSDVGMQIALFGGGLGTRSGVITYVSVFGNADVATIVRPVHANLHAEHLQVIFDHPTTDRHWMHNRVVLEVAYQQASAAMVHAQVRRDALRRFIDQTQSAIDAMLRVG